MCLLEKYRAVGLSAPLKYLINHGISAFLALLFAQQSYGVTTVPLQPNQNSPEPSPIPVSTETTNQVAAKQVLYIKEFRVRGAHHLARNVVEETVYPFLGPGRTTNDIEQARAALEKAYQDKGYQTVSVQI